MSNSSSYSTTQRGSGLGIKIVYLFFRLFGYKGLHFILFFVVLYYTLTTPTLKKYLKEYYMLCVGRFNYLIYYKHIYTFALIFADRIFSKKFTDRYKVIVQKDRNYIHTKDSGVMFLLSHVGDWSVSEMMPTQNNKTINIVMKEEIKESIKSFEEKISSDDSKSKLHIIDISDGTIAVATQLAKAFLNNEVVAMMADRYLSKESSVSVRFLGRTIRINKNPFDVAYNRKVPMVAFFAMREGDYLYSPFYFEMTEFDMSISKEESIQLKAQEYTLLLEGMVRKYPSQWLNHYDFFA